MSDKKRYFFGSGICFECRNCGFCCTGSSGTIYVNQNEILEIAKFLDMDINKFKEEFLYPFRDSFSIKEKDNYACIFYENGCSIYSVRPNQCRTYPFWIKNMRSESNWENEKKQCPGIGKGKLYSQKEILDILEESEIWPSFSFLFWFANSRYESKWFLTLFLSLCLGTKEYTAFLLALIMFLLFQEKDSRMNL